MSPVSPSEVRAVDDQVEQLARYELHSAASMHIIKVVRMIWNILKRHHGWR